MLGDDQTNYLLMLDSPALYHRSYHNFLKTLNPPLDSMGLQKNQKLLQRFSEYIIGWVVSLQHAMLSYCKFCYHKPHFEKELSLFQLSLNFLLKYGLCLLRSKYVELKSSNPGHPDGIPSAVTLKSKYKPISLGNAISSNPKMKVYRSHPPLTWKFNKGFHQYRKFFVTKAIITIFYL